MGARPLKRAIDQYLIAPLAGILWSSGSPKVSNSFSFAATVRASRSNLLIRTLIPAASDLAAAEAETPRSELATVILAPQGTLEEFKHLQAEYDDVERVLASPRLGSVER